MKEKNQFDYGNTVVNNFFMYLSKKNITQKTYANDNNMVESTLSKWKKGESSLTVDQIKQAASYFGLTVNDLFYDEKEKKNLEVLADKSYDPIIAQQSLKVKLYGQFFSKPHKILVICLFIFVLLGFMTYILKDNSQYFSFLIVLGIPLSIRLIYINSFDEKTYIINYLDDIYYRRKESNNKFYFLSLLFRILSVVMFLYYITFLKGYEQATTIERGLLITLIALIMFLIFGAISAITDLPKNFKLEIYDHEISIYNSSRFYLLVHFAIFTVAVMLTIFNSSNYLPFLISSGVFLIINCLDFVNISLEYSKYVLMYQENIKNPRELFPK